jgi:hypothetical protein
MLIEKSGLLPHAKILTASKRNFFQNTELLDVAFSTDFGNIQRMYLDLVPLEVDNWNSIYEYMDENGNPVPGSLWAKRSEVLGRIWPDWDRAFEVGAVKPEDYAAASYLVPTLTQFLGMWNENVARAGKFAAEAR